MLGGSGGGHTAGVGCNVWAEGERSRASRLQYALTYGQRRGERSVSKQESPEGVFSLRAILWAEAVICFLRLMALQLLPLCKL